MKTNYGVEMQEQAGDLYFDQVNGYGATGKNQDVGYFGFVAYMLPSTFLKLSLPLAEFQVKDEMDFFFEAYEKKEAFASPMLFVEYEKGRIPQVVGPEGRHRCTMFDAVQPDVPIPVHVFFQYMRARDITEYELESFSTLAKSEGAGNTIVGPVVAALHDENIYEFELE